MPAYRRSQIVSENEISTCHCINRCVRRAFLCGRDKHWGQNYEHRKVWFLELLSLLTSVFAVELVHYGIMDNHYHLQLTIRPDKACQWSDEEVVERWWRLYPKRGQADLLEAIRQAWQADPHFLAVRRQRLSSLSWFMKCLNEPIAKRANREDGVTGCVWSSSDVAVFISATNGNALHRVNFTTRAQGLRSDVFWQNTGGWPGHQRCRRRWFSEPDRSGSVGCPRTPARAKLSQNKCLQ